MTGTAQPIAVQNDAASPPVVSVRGLRVSLQRGSVRSDVVRGIDMDINGGEILAVVGESGSGKSVTTLALMGLLPAASRPRIEGSAVVDGVDMIRASPERQRIVRRDSLGAVFQDPMTSLNPTMRVGQQIAEAAGSADEAIRMMARVGIPQPGQRFRCYPHELSGGLRQRAMIAMAIAGAPPLVIADEPTTALDVTIQAQVLGVLRDLRSELGCGILLITHDLGVAAQIADRIAVMQDGEIVERGPALQVLDRPEHPYTRRLLRARLDLDPNRARALPVPARPAGERLLGIADVRCEFPARDDRGRRTPLKALRGVSIDVEQGDSVALVGESGCGKSTLLRAIAGLERRWSGSIGGPGRQHVQMVFQDAGASLTPWLRVEEILAERLRRSGLDRAAKRWRVRETLDLLGLPHETLAARPAELSGGQRQRVALARATIVPPRVLLCDEPTSSLDVSLAATVLELIRRLRRELGMTVVFVTHDLGVARFIGDRIAVMYLGRLVETGPVESVIAAPKHPYTQALVAAVPGARRELPRIAGEPASPLAPPPGCAFHPRCPVARPECTSAAFGSRLSDDSARHAVACVLHGEG